MTNGFGLYVHVPFCVHRCSYCDFFSLSGYESESPTRFTDRICDEIRHSSTELLTWAPPSEAVTSIFVGGGTPSLLPVEKTKKIFDSLKAAFKWAIDVEVTMEANPETLSVEYLRELFEKTPINRISCGAQSFQPQFLATLERKGSAESIERASKFFRALGFKNYSFDLIFGIPGQDWALLKDDLQRAVALEPRHISFYSLTLKPGHPLYRSLPTDDISADLYERGVEYLASSGYLRYEISNFSQRGFESRHNQLYWNGGDFFGVGPSASSRIFRDGRFWHHKQVSDFKSYLSDEKVLSKKFECTSHAQTILEATFLELRKTVGVSHSNFQERYKYDLLSAKNFLKFCEGGLVVREGDRISLSERGLLLADTVTSELVDL